MLRYYHVVFLLVIGLFKISPAWSYPQFIAHGYESCLTCHYNPFGNGPLNDYARAVSATGIAARDFHPNEWGEEELANRSGFFYQKPGQHGPWRPSLDYRGMHLKRNTQDSSLQESKWLHMQMDASVSAQLGEKKDYIISLTYGVIPSNTSHTGQTQTLSREHYIAKRWDDSRYGLYIGKMDKVFGIRVPDHIAYSRIVAGATQNAQTHGAVFHIADPKYDLGIHYFIGDLESGSDQRSQGYSIKYDYSWSKDFRVGLSLMKESFNEHDNQTGAFHLKRSVGKGSSLMAEIGQQNRSIVNAQNITARYLFVQNHILLRRGLYYLTTFEYYQPNTKDSRELYRIAPGLQYFPTQRVEFRLDMYTTRNFSDDMATEDSVDIAGQVHLWF